MNRCFNIFFLNCSGSSWPPQGCVYPTLESPGFLPVIWWMLCYHSPASCDRGHIWLDSPFLGALGFRSRQALSFQPSCFLLRVLLNWREPRGKLSQLLLWLQSFAVIPEPLSQSQQLADTLRAQGQGHCLGLGYSSRIGEDAEKLESLCTADGNIKWYSHCGKQLGGSLKT